jgi:hypothetical protein
MRRGREPLLGRERARSRPGPSGWRASRGGHGVRGLHCPPRPMHHLHSRRDLLPISLQTTTPCRTEASPEPPRRWSARHDPLRRLREAAAQPAPARPAPRIGLDRTSARWVAPLLAGRGLELRGFVELEPWVTAGARGSLLILGFDEGAGLEALGRRAGLGAPRCLVALPLADWGAVEACLAAGAEEVIAEGDAAGLFGALGRLLGVPGSAEPRQSFAGSVSVSLGRGELEVESVDLRPSGVALRSFPGAAPGRVVQVSFALAGESLALPARVVRAWGRGEGRFVGLRFVGLAPELRAWLRDALEPRPVAHAEPEGELEAWRREVREVLGLDPDAREGGAPPASDPAEVLAASLDRLFRRMG